MAKTKKSAAAKSDAAEIAELKAQIAALTAKITPAKYTPQPRPNAYDPTAAMAAPTLPDIYDAAAIEADVRALGSQAFPAVYGKSSGMPNIQEPLPYPNRKFGESIVDQICDKFLKA